MTRHAPDENVLRHVNVLIRQGLEDLDRREPVAFFCECDDTECYGAVWLTLGEFDELVGAPYRPLLAEIHTPRRRAPATETAVRAA